MVTSNSLKHRILRETIYYLNYTRMDTYGYRRETYGKPKILRKTAGLEDQNHSDFDGFDNITSINWEKMECTADSKAVICDKRPLELYGKTIWKQCLFGYICIKRSDYVDEFRRCTDLGEAFSPILCNSAYEYPRNFNCDFYDKFACQRSKHYIYSCVCINNHRNADLKTCVNTTVCSKGLPEKEIISSTTKVSERTTVHTIHSTVPRSSSRNIVTPQRKCNPALQLSVLLKAIFSILLVLNYYYNRR